MSLSRRGLPLLFCLALLGLYLTPALAQGPTPLTYQFKQGDKLEYVIEHIGIMKVIDGVQVDFLSTASTIEVAWASHLQGLNFYPQSPPRGLRLLEDKCGIWIGCIPEHRHAGKLGQHLLEQL